MLHNLNVMRQKVCKMYENNPFVKGVQNVAQLKCDETKGVQNV
jgi:hypothetical protein